MSDLWLEVDDNKLSAAELVALVAQKTAAREAAIGSLVLPDIAGFGVVQARVGAGENGRFSTLQHHLTQLNQLPDPETAPMLAVSPATRLPVLGALWVFIRQQAHGLVLFYVNRLAAYDSQRQIHLLNALNELTALVQAQQAQIEQLQQQLGLHEQK